MANNHIYEATIKIDKSSIANQIIEGYSDAMTKVDKIVGKNGKITYEITGETEHFKALLKDLQNKDYKIGTDIIIDTTDKELQKIINKISKDLTISVTPTVDKNFINNVQKQVDNQGDVHVNISPVLDGFVDKIQSSINDQKINININGIVNNDSNISNLNAQLAETGEIGKNAGKQISRSQDEIQKEIEETNNRIKNQKDWLEHLWPITKDYSTSGKGEANKQLRDATRGIVRYRMSKDEDLGSYTKEKRIVNWWNSYQEAIRQGSSEKVLNENNVGIYEKEYQRAFNTLKECYDDRLKTLEEYKEKLVKLQKELDEATNVNTKENDKASESKKEFNTVNDSVAESASASSEKLLEEASAFDKVAEAADKAAEAKKNFNNANTNEELKEAQVEAKETAENIHLITDELGNIKTFYRGLRNSMGQGLVSDRFNGATFWTDNFDLAKEYSEWNKIESANLEMINPLEIEGKGSNWNSIEYLGNYVDEASKKNT